MIIKVNAITDDQMIRVLYRASQAGVTIDLIVRGICSLRPGIPGVSDHIRVRSIVGRFLEHSRIFWFHNGGHEEMYIGSADLMERNLDRRVETLTPIRDPEILEHLRDVVLARLPAGHRTRDGARFGRPLLEAAVRPASRSTRSSSCSSTTRSRETISADAYQAVAIAAARITPNRGNAIAATTSRPATVMRKASGPSGQSNARPTRVAAPPCVASKPTSTPTT